MEACVFYRPCMVDTMEKRRGQAVWEKRRRLYVLRKTRAVCSSMGGLQGGDDEAAEGGVEMVVRHTYVIFDCRLTVG